MLSAGTPAFEAAARNEGKGNKKTSLLCYRLYNVYDRIEMDTVTMQHAVVFTVIQNVADANAYLVTDIKSIAVDRGRIVGEIDKSPQAKGNAHVDTIAQLYEIVKKNRVTATQFALNKAIANTSHSPRLDTSIGEENKVVKASSRDSGGNELSAEQQEYFKDSKVRDEDGRLQVVYHGARDTDRTVFTRNVTYFTDDESMAESYSPNGGRYTGYVNITKPLEIDAKGGKWSAIPVPPEMEERRREQSPRPTAWFVGMGGFFCRAGPWCCYVHLPQEGGLGAWLLLQPQKPQRRGRRCGFIIISIISALMF